MLASLMPTWSSTLAGKGWGSWIHGNPVGIQIREHIRTGQAVALELSREELC